MISATELFLKRSKMDPTAVKQALLRCDSTVLGLDELKALKKLIPTADDVSFELTLVDTGMK